MTIKNNLDDSFSIDSEEIFRECSSESGSYK